MKLSVSQVREAARLRSQGVPVKALAYDFGVHYETMRKYLRQHSKGLL